MLLMLLLQSQSGRNQDPTFRTVNHGAVGRYQQILLAVEALQDNGFANTDCLLYSHWIQDPNATALNFYQPPTVQWNGGSATLFATFLILLLIGGVANLFGRACIS